MIGTLFLNNRLHCACQHEPSLDSTLYPIVKEQMNSLPNTNSPDENCGESLVWAKQCLRSRKARRIPSITGFQQLGGLHAVFQQRRLHRGTRTKNIVCRL